MQISIKTRGAAHRASLACVSPSPTQHSVVCHPSLQSGVYHFDEAFEIDTHAASAHHVFGSRAIHLRNATGESLYLVEQAALHGVNRGVIALLPALFAQAWSAAHALLLTIDRVWLLWNQPRIGGAMSDLAVPLINFRRQATALPSILRKSTDTLPTARSGDALFFELFPDVPRLFAPHSLLAWTAWLKHRPDATDRSHEGPVTGFSTATHQRVTAIPDGWLVELFDAQLRRVGIFTAHPEGTDVFFLTIGAHAFFVEDIDGRPHVCFSSAHQAYVWDGEHAPRVGPPALLLDRTAAGMLSQSAIKLKQLGERAVYPTEQWRPASVLRKTG